MKSRYEKINRICFVVHGANLRVLWSDLGWGQPIDQYQIQK